MSKLVVLKLGDGSFDQGFPVTLQIGNDGDRPSLEITGKLPKAPKIAQYYSGWQAAYRGLGSRYRLEAKAGFVTNVSKLEVCCNAAQVLRDATNAWLHSEEFRSIREKLLEQLMPSDEIRVLIQTEDSRLRRLPWHLWDFCDRYSKAEIALSAPVYERVEKLSPPKAKVRILAILGNSAGINTQADRLLLEQLPDAEITFLVEPQPQELTDQLWGQGWDILFFAGHSSSQSRDQGVGAGFTDQLGGKQKTELNPPSSSRQGGETGRIYINQTDSLTIEQLKYAVKKAVERGLKIAIFNSCDGLGLARDLADSQIPQMIVMREPVPDVVAQEFLKYFLKAFARGETFYLAVREARERLQGLETEFPCATWLPMISQNPAELPPTWQGLCGKKKRNNTTQIAFLQNRQIGSRRSGLGVVLLASALVTSIVMGVRYLGMLQPLELQAFDQLTRLRPAEKPDPRLLVVTITEADIQAQNQDHRRGSLSDLALNQLLQKLEQFKPRAIGLDIYRDYPVDPKYADLATSLRQSDRTIAVCKVTASDVNELGVPPPPEIPTQRLGFSDFVADSDGIVRRHLLALTPNPTSPCTASYAFSAQLAFLYLAQENILPKSTLDGFLQLDNVVFKPMDDRTGGYQGVDAWGHQVLLNYRFHRSPQNIAAQVSLTDVLKGQINPDSIKDRIVLIGTTANSFPDFWLTPYSNGQGLEQQTPGVFVQAQMVSQILSAVLDGRPLLWVWTGWGETFWVWGWSLIGGILVWRLKTPLHLGLAITVALGSLYGLCFGFLVQSSCWVPLVPSALALVATSVSVVAYPRFVASTVELL